jgi:hypothetical protein
VPPFANTHASANYQEIVIHGGYQAEQKHSRFPLHKDAMPQGIAKDNRAAKSHAVTHHPHPSSPKISPALKSNNQSSAFPK